jgi:hypothetical protein
MKKAIVLGFLAAALGLTGVSLLGHGGVTTNGGGGHACINGKC